MLGELSCRSRRFEKSMRYLSRVVFDVWKTDPPLDTAKALGELVAWYLYVCKEFNSDELHFFHEAIRETQRQLVASRTFRHSPLRNNSSYKLVHARWLLHQSVQFQLEISGKKLSLADAGVIASELEAYLGWRLFDSDNEISGIMEQCDDRPDVEE